MPCTSTITSNKLVFKFERLQIVYFCIKMQLMEHDIPGGHPQRPRGSLLGVKKVSNWQKSEWRKFEVVVKQPLGIYSYWTL